jgi:hypothetical protein
VSTIDAFERTAALWLCRATDAPAVATAAAELLASGIDTESVRELAGVTAAHGGWDVDPLIEAVLRELGRPPLPDDGERTLVLAVCALCWSYLAGRMTAEELLDRMWNIPGVYTLSLARGLVTLEPWVSAFPGHSVARAEDAARVEARAFLAAATEWLA